MATLSQKAPLVPLHCFALLHFVPVTAPSPRPGGDAAHSRCPISASQVKPRVGRASLWAWSGQSPGWLVTSCPSRTIARPSQACPVPRASWSGQGLAGRGASGNREGRIGGLRSPGPCPAGLVTSVAVSLPCGHSAGQACPLPWLEPPPCPAAAWAAASCCGWSLARTRLCTAVTCPRLCEPSPRSPRTCISLLRGPRPPVAAPPPRSGPRASGIGSTCGFVTMHSLRPPIPTESESALSEAPGDP